MAVPLYFDHNADHDLLLDLRSRGYDVLSAAEDGADHFSDERILRRATELGRVVFTHNRKDFRRLHHRWMAAGMAHTGILTATMRRLDLVPGRVLAFLEHEPQDAVANRLMAAHDYDRFVES